MSKGTKALINDNNDLCIIITPYVRNYYEEVPGSINAIISYLLLVFQHVFLHSAGVERHYGVGNCHHCFRDPHYPNPMSYEVIDSLGPILITIIASGPNPIILS